MGFQWQNTQTLSCAEPVSSLVFVPSTFQQCLPHCRFGPTLHLTSSAIEAMFPRAFERIGIGFYRSKITSWMAAQEEDYRCGAVCGSRVRKKCCQLVGCLHPVDVAWWLAMM